MKIFLTGKLPDFALKELRKVHIVNVHTGKIPISRAKLLSGICNADGLVCFPFDSIDQDVIDSAISLKAICTFSVGFDHIDVKYAKSKNIQIGYTPDVLTEATADLAFSLILDVTRRVTESDRIIRAGKWTKPYGAVEFVGTGLQSKTLGILGMGRIGQALAKRAAVFGMKTSYYNRHRFSNNVEKSLGVKYSGLSRLISKSDIISVHVPYTKDTHGMINAAFFKKMKKTAILVNTARGKIVNQRDLTVALKGNEIGGAGLDVFESEPLQKGDLLTKLNNVVLSAHIGSSTVQTRDEMARLTIKNLNLGMAGKKPIHSVE